DCCMASIQAPILGAVANAKSKRTYQIGIETAGSSPRVDGRDWACVGRSEARKGCEGKWQTRHAPHRWWLAAPSFAPGQTRMFTPIDRLPIADAEERQHVRERWNDDTGRRTHETVVALLRDHPRKNFLERAHDAGLLPILRDPWDLRGLSLV